MLSAFLTCSALVVNLQNVNLHRSAFKLFARLAVFGSIDPFSVYHSHVPSNPVAWSEGLTW
jgi:hypothetical protein